MSTETRSRSSRRPSTAIRSGSNTGRRSLGGAGGGVAPALLAAGRPDPHRLGVHELVHAELGQLPAVAALLHPAERQLRIAGRHPVDERHARLDVTDELLPLRLVLAPEVGPEAVRVAVGDLD